MGQKYTQLIHKKLEPTSLTNRRIVAILIPYVYILGFHIKFFISDVSLYKAELY